MANVKELFEALKAKDFDLAVRHVARHTASVRLINTRKPQHEKCYPLHLAIIQRAPSTLILDILNAWPEAARERRAVSTTQLPLSIAFAYGAGEEVISNIFDKFPPAVAEDGKLTLKLEQDHKSNIDWVCQCHSSNGHNVGFRKMSFEVARVLLVKHTDAIDDALASALHCEADPVTVLALLSLKPEVLTRPLTISRLLPEHFTERPSYTFPDYLRSLTAHWELDNQEGIQRLVYDVDETEDHAWKLDNTLAAAVCHGYPPDTIRKMRALDPSGAPYPSTELFIAACLYGHSPELAMDFLIEDYAASFSTLRELDVNGILRRLEKYANKTLVSLTMRSLTESSPSLPRMGVPLAPRITLPDRLRRAYDQDRLHFFMTCLKTIHLSGGKLQLGAESLALLVGTMGHDLQYISWLVHAGVSTEYGFVEAEEKLRDVLSRGLVIVQPALTLLRAWRRGEALYKTFLIRSFSTVLPHLAATTIGLMFGGGCQVESCSCHDFAQSATGMGDVIQTIQHSEPAAAREEEMLAMQEEHD